jgi:serine/threonine-protein kinase
MARARVQAEKALELDPDLSDAHVSMALIRGYGDWDRVGAEKEYERAIELDPGNAFARQQYALHLAGLGRLDEAIEQMEIAHDLDPLAFDPMGYDLGRLYELTGQIEPALAHWEDRAKLAPNYHQPQLRLGDYYCRQGEADRAIPYLRRAIELSPDDPWMVANLGYCYAISGRRNEAVQMLGLLAERAASEYVTPVGIALIHVGLGQKEAAFDALERAYDIRAMRLKDLRIDVRWDPLRDDPRFGAMLRRVGLVSFDGDA